MPEPGYLSTIFFWGLFNYSLVFRATPFLGVFSLHLLWTSNVNTHPLDGEFGLLLHMCFLICFLWEFQCCLVAKTIVSHIFIISLLIPWKFHIMHPNIKHFPDSHKLCGLKSVVLEAQAYRWYNLGCLGLVIQ